MKKIARNTEEEGVCSKVPKSIESLFMPYCECVSICDGGEKRKRWLKGAKGVL